MHFGNFHPYYSNSFALIIGINEYKNTGSLNYATNDADEIAKLLEFQLGFSRKNITLIKDKAATKTAINDAYLELVNKADSPDDRVLFFFAGHGYTVDGYQGSVGYLVPTNEDPKKLASLIRWDDLTRNADLIPAKHILFILDACFSGLAFKRAIQPGNQRFLSEMLQRRARQVITAGKADQVVSDGGGPDGRNSVFTGHIIEGLKGKALNKNGVLTANDLMHYVYERLSNDPNSEQTPHYGHVDGDGDFVFIPTKEATTLNEDVIVEIHPERPELDTTSVKNLQQVNQSLFSNLNGYSNPSHPNFGRNPYSDKLGIMNFDDGNEEKTFSWLALVIEPLNNNDFEINLSKLSNEFGQYQPTGQEPFERLLPPRQKMTSINSVILYNELKNQSNYWSKYIRIEKSGSLELCDAYNSFFSHQTIRAFRYVQIIGIVWQFLFFAKSILKKNNYNGSARLLVNLIGTKETSLADFAKGKGKDDKYWVEAGGYGGWRFDGNSNKCSDSNLQMKYEFILGNINELASKKIIENVAETLGLAYNHQSEPRCFVYGTDTFPWNQFFNGQSY